MLFQFIAVIFCLQSSAGVERQGFSRHKVYSNSSLSYSTLPGQWYSKQNNAMLQSQTSNEMRKLLDQLSYSKSYHTVFVDLLDIALYPMIVHDHGNLARNPLLDYTEKERPLFTTLLTLMGNEMDNYTDALGDIFMEFLSFGKNGQFFTPQDICDMMAQMTINDASQMDNKTVCDCACGSGRTLLAAAKLNRNMIFYGSDIDLTCVKMTVLNLAYNTLRGEVHWMNTLSLDHYGSFVIQQEPFTRLPYIVTLPADKSLGVTAIKEVAKAMPEFQKQQVQHQLSIQQTLF